MTIHFSRAEYWLLDVAVQESVSIADLLSPHIGEILNRGDHQCSAEELADGLERLFTDKFIKGYRIGGLRRRRTLTRPQIEVELRRPKVSRNPDNPTSIGHRHPDESYYDLTPAGGVAWESFACPDWNLFVDGIGSATYHDADPPHPASGYGICPTRHVIERYLALAWHIGHHVDETSIRWDTVSPWKATYWKTLSTAHRVRYKMMYHGTRGWTDRASEVFNLSHMWHRWRS